MAGLGPAIHVFAAAPKTWMRGTSPRMTALETSAVGPNERERHGSDCAAVSDQSMRAFLAALEAERGAASGEALRVDPRFEIASVLSLRERGPAQLFERVRGHAMPVVGNLLNSRDRFARALGIARGDLHEFCLAALRNAHPAGGSDAGAAARDLEHRRDIELASSFRCRHGSSARPAPISAPA